MAGPHQTGADTCQEEARQEKLKRRNVVEKWLIIPRLEWSTGIPYSELFHLKMELMKGSRIWTLWKIFYCQMECKISDFGVILSWPGALQLFDKTEISSESFLPHFFSQLCNITPRVGTAGPTVGRWWSLLAWGEVDQESCQQQGLLSIVAVSGRCRMWSSTCPPSQNALGMKNVCVPPTALCN